MTEEFCLSDRIINPTKKIYLLDTYESIPVEDVKEFVRRLKEDILFIGNNQDVNIVWLVKRLNTLAGEKLI